mgnify:CR=1 FL=1
MARALDISGTLIHMQMKRYIQEILIGILVVIMLGVGGTAYYFYSETQKLKTDQQSITANEVESLVAEIGALIVLPEGETPTVATVSDPGRLKDQPFFANAKAGDKVLLYSTARKAYLYDPIIKKLVEVAPLNVGGSDNASAQENR